MPNPFRSSFPLPHFQYPILHFQIITLLLTASCATKAVHKLPLSDSTYYRPSTTSPTPITAIKRPDGGIQLTLQLQEANQTPPQTKTFQLNRSPSKLRIDPTASTIHPPRLKTRPQDINDRDRAVFRLSPPISPTPPPPGTSLPIHQRQNFTDIMPVSQEALWVTKNAIYWVKPQAQTLLVDQTFLFHQNSTTSTHTQGALQAPAIVFDALTLPYQIPFLISDAVDEQ